MYVVYISSDNEIICETPLLSRYQSIADSKSEQSKVFPLRLLMLSRNEIIAVCAAGAFIFICILIVVFSNPSSRHQEKYEINNVFIDDKLIDEIAFIKFGTYGKVKAVTIIKTIMLSLELFPLSRRNK